MFKRVKNLFNRQSGDRGDKRTPHRGVSDYLHVEGAEGGQIEKKTESHMELSKKKNGAFESDRARPSSEWYMGTSKNELDKGGDAKPLDKIDTGSSTNENIKPTTVSNRSGLVESSSPVEKRKKAK